MDLEERIKRIEERLGYFEKSDRFIFSKTIEMQDGRNIQVARGTGTKIATASDQKLGFFGQTPIIQPPSIGSVTMSGSYGNAEKNSLQKVYDAVRNLGLMSQ